MLTEFVGVNATHGPLAGEPSADIARGAVARRRARPGPQRRRTIYERDRAVDPDGPPAVTGFAGGRPKVEEIVAYWPALIPKEEINPAVEVLEA